MFLHSHNKRVVYMHGGFLYSGVLLRMGNTLNRLTALGGLPLGEHTCTGTSLTTQLKIPIVIKIYIQS